MNSTSGDEFNFGFEVGKKKTSTANFSRTIVIDHSETDRFINSFPKSVSAFTMEIVFFTVKSSNVSFLNGTNTITFIFSAVEVASQTDTLVTVSSKSFSGFENFIAINTWTLFSGDAFSIVSISVEWTVAAVDTFGLIAFGFWAEAAWSARRSTSVVFLTGWAFNFASTVSSPFNMNSVSRTFSEVGGHGVTHRTSGLIFVLGEANVFFTSFKVWSWVDDIGAFGFHDVRTEHDSLGGFSHTSSSGHITEGLFGSFKTLIRSFPGVGEKSDGFDGGTISSGQVVGLIVIKNTAKTSSLTHQSFVDFDEDRFITVPFQSPRVGDFFDNQIIGNSGDVHGEEVGWNGNKFTVESGNNWFTFFVFGQSDSGVSNVDVDRSRAFSFTFASRIIDDFDGEGARKNVLHESIRTVSLESEDFTIKSSVVMLAPGHTVSSLFWVDLTFVHNSKNFSEIVFIDNFGFLDTFWEVWVWVPFAFGARVKSSHWNSGGKFVAFFTGWEASKLTFVIFARNFTVDWSIEMLAFVSVRNTRWESVTTSW